MQEGPTSIRVSWTPSSGANGYTISYTGGGSSDSVTVSGGSTDNYLLTGLVMEASYTISIIATSQHFFSGSVGFPTVTLGENVHVVYVTYAIFICLHSQLERLKTESVVDFFQSVQPARIQRAGLVSDAVCHVTLSAPTCTPPPPSPPPSPSLSPHRTSMPTVMRL